MTHSDGSRTRVFTVASSPRTGRGPSRAYGTVVRFTGHTTRCPVRAGTLCRPAHGEAGGQFFIPSVTRWSGPGVDAFDTGAAVLGPSVNRELVARAS